MNNLVFNTTAAQLKASVYAMGTNSQLQILKLDNDGYLKTAISGNVTIGNNSLTVAGDVTISNPTLTIGNATLTVKGDVTISNPTLTIGNATLTVAGDVTISNPTLTIGNATLTVAGDVTISNTSVAVKPILTSLTATIGTATGTDVVLNNTDLSAVRDATFFIYNTSTTPLTLSLQFSPTTDTTSYITSTVAGTITVADSGKTYVHLSEFAHYVRLQYALGESTASFVVYFNGQS